MGAKIHKKAKNLETRNIGLICFNNTKWLFLCILNVIEFSEQQFWWIVGVIIVSTTAGILISSFLWFRRKKRVLNNLERFIYIEKNEAFESKNSKAKGMIDRLSGDEKKIFRNSLVDNALELTNLLTRLNVTKDPKLEQARQSLEQTLVGVTADELRDSQGARQEILARVNQIMETI